MTSIYQEAMGDEFGRLHPRLQWRFGFSSADGVCQIGHGVMEEVWRGPWWTLPFLVLGSTRRLLFPSRGRDVPFTISNYAYVDGFGRETVTWSRRFKTSRRIRAFDATMIRSHQRGVIVDYLGTHQHLAIDLYCSADDDGAMCLRSGDLRFSEGPVHFRFPLLFAGEATVRESYDETTDRFQIDVAVVNKRFGRLFGYRGTFKVVERPCTADEIPIDVMPVREERRE
ncbi:MAG: DUF4166 domain-containing protein [Ilumatobacteraceae bacterium]